MTATIVVEAPARLHFGLLDLRGSLGRRFGGIGASAPAVGVRVSVSAADTLESAGEDAERAAEFAARFLRSHGISGGARIHVTRAIPRHSGLGSGTQLALAVARGLAELYATGASPADLARAVGRGHRSAVGTWVFAHGGFVVEGGRRPDDDRLGPLLARIAMPSDWRCVVALPSSQPGVSGLEEAHAFASLPVPAGRDAERVAYLVLMAMLPAVADGDLAAFGEALTEVQEINGRWFAPAQGGSYAPGPSTDLVRVMRESGAPGVGQSSWGPSVYAVLSGDAQVNAIVARIRDVFRDEVVIFSGGFPSEGAVVTRSS